MPNATVEFLDRAAEAAGLKRSEAMRMTATVWADGQLAAAARRRARGGTERSDGTGLTAGSDDWMRKPDEIEAAGSPERRETLLKRIIARFGEMPTAGMPTNHAGRRVATRYPHGSNARILRTGETDHEDLGRTRREPQARMKSRRLASDDTPERWHVYRLYEAIDAAAAELIRDFPDGPPESGSASE